MTDISVALIFIFFFSWAPIEISYAIFNKKIAFDHSAPIKFDTIYEQSKNAAEKFIIKHELSNARQKIIDPYELPIRLNALVHNHCELKKPDLPTNDINDLFESNCQALCGGISYVLRGLLEYYGYNTRYMNFYNLPGTGNHSAIEVEIEPGKWSFFDPTFGVFFLGEKNTVLTTDQIRLSRDAHSLRKKALIARLQKNDYKSYLEKPIHQLYYSAENSKNTYFIDNYLLADNVSHVGSNVMVPFILKADLSNGDYALGNQDFKSYEEGRNDFLAATTSLLRIKGREEQVSFLFSKLGRHAAYFDSLHIIEMENAQENTDYLIKISGFSKKNMPTKLFFTPKNKDITLHNSDAILINFGKFSVSKKIRMKSRNGMLFMNLEGKDDMVDLFFISINQIS